MLLDLSSVFLHFMLSYFKVLIYLNVPSVECWKHVERIVDLEIQQNEHMEEFKEANLRHDLVIGKIETIKVLSKIIV